MGFSEGHVILHNTKMGRYLTHIKAASIAPIIPMPLSHFSLFPKFGIYQLLNNNYLIPV